MYRFLKWAGIAIGLLAVLCAASIPIGNYLKERRRVNYREADVTRGRIVAVVNATGTVKPVRLVNVGAFVSGPIKEVYVVHNDEVKKGDKLALIDPLIYDAAVDRDQAALDTRVADLERALALLEQAGNDLERANKLRAVNTSYLSDTELDQFRFNHKSLKAQYNVAKASVVQAKAQLANSLANKEYTVIVSPEDGVVIDRKVDPGQTVAASFQTPDMFVVAPDMRKEMWVFANVDEADIGLIREAKESNQPVRFTVDSYPDDLFTGKIAQIRQSATTTQNVVTYPVIVSAPNPELKLMPSMTANLSFQLREKDKVLRVPNAALRFFPVREQVRPEDRHLLDTKAAVQGEAEDQTDSKRSAEEKAEMRKKRHRRHVWVVDGDFLRGVEIVTGLSDNNNTEVVSGELTEKDKVVTGIQPRN
jgi:HlyD family secretion protein